ncbi:MAG: response regulator [Magnetococcales bacterium]|nr:response regulator [Magnetococcales bacterium]
MGELKKPKILIVDDSPSQIIIIGEISDVDYEVLVATNGKEALEMVYAESPELILLDILMPEMDGFEVCRQLKSDPETKDIPVIFITVAGDIENETTGFSLGAVDFITKPIHPIKLQNRIKTHLALAQQHKLERDTHRRLTTMVKIIQENSAELKQKENYLRSLFNNAIDAIITTDNNGMILEINNAAQQLFGYSAEQTIGKNVIDLLLPPQIQDEHREVLANYSAQTKAGEAPSINRMVNITGQRSDGVLVELEVGLTSMFQNNSFSYTAFIHDITKHKQLVKSLTDTLKAAELSNKSKSEFLANMSHEIRSPMNSIMGMTELVLATKLNNDQQENLEIVLNSAKSLLGVINDILDYSKIEADQLNLESINFDIRGQVENVCNNVAILAHTKEVELFCNIASDIPQSFIGDPHRLSQVLNNLINNAIKFTTQGEIIVSVEQVVDKNISDDTCELKFKISDTGIGIPPDHIATIFDQFTQVDGSTTRNYGGSGLGLAITKRLINKMGGDIWVESVEGEGSVFQFSNRFKIGKRRGSSPEHIENDLRKNVISNDHLNDVKILLAVKNSAGQKIIKDMLTNFGAKVEVVKDYPALEQALDSTTNNGNAYDATILDYGLSFAEFLGPKRQFPEKIEASKTVLMIPTTFQIEELATDKQMKYMVVLKKPIKQYQLLKEIDIILGRDPIYVDDEEQRPKQSKQNSVPLSILLVEDLPDNQKLATTILQQAGHSIMIANNGSVALDMLAANNFDLVLMDLHMAEMDGYDATKNIRGGKGIGECDPTIPIVAVTALAMDEEKNKCMASGMNGYLRKPYMAAELLEVIQQFAIKPEITQKQKTTSDKSAILSPDETDLRILHSRQQEFLEYGPKHLFRLHQALLNRKVVPLLKAAKWLKEAATGIGANRIKIEAIRLEGSAEMKQWDHTLDIIGNLEQEFQKAVSELTQKL